MNDNPDNSLPRTVVPSPPPDLTPKQEAFCLAYIESGNASEAYRQAYDAEKMKPETINRKAKELLDNGKIAARVVQIQAGHQERHDVTVGSLTKELEADRKLARSNDQASAAIAATMGKAKLHGLLKDKVEHSGSVDLSSSAEWAGLQAAILSALTPYPDARKAVLGTLEGRGDG